MNARGMTLIELMTATVLSVLVILAIGQVDVSRVRLSDEVRRRATAQSEAALALAHMAKSLQQADRIQWINPSDIQFRRFIGDPTAPGALDNAANYRWAQYQLVDINPVDGTMDTIRFYDDTAGGCGVDDSFGASGLTIQYRDEAVAPPGGEPPVQDNNVLQMTIEGRYTTEVTIRGGAYTDLMTGLAPLGVSDPPGSC
jgi:hypothetical protein